MQVAQNKIKPNSCTVYNGIEAKQQHQNTVSALFLRTDDLCFC